jgi:hypothetical protein
MQERMAAQSIKTRANAQLDPAMTWPTACRAYIGDGADCSEARRSRRRCARSANRRK